MPVEILELVVRANVQESANAAVAPAAGNAQQGANMQQQAIIQQCVEQVLEILRNREER
jgi:hypothetical protein